VTTTARDRLLTVPEVADRLGTGERFVRRLIAERRITYVYVGRFIRIPESAVDEFIEAGRVERLRPSRRVRRTA
jgi:excisionase family DNA binding protein